MYTKITIHLTNGDPVQFIDDEIAKVSYQAKPLRCGSLAIEKCTIDEAEVSDHLRSRGDPGRMLAELLTGQASHDIPGHKHDLVVLYGPGTWTKVEFA